MKRKTRFSPGGLNPFQAGDVDPYSAARDEDGGISQAKGRDLKSEIEGMQGMYDKEDWEQKGPSTQAAKPLSFKEAFADARKRGDSTFTWNGSKYTTEVASPKAAAPKAAAPKAAAPNAPSTARSMLSGPTAQEVTKAETRRKSIYNLDRDPLVQKIKEAMRGPNAEQRQAKAELERESRRGTKPASSDPYRGRTAEERMKAMRGYAAGGSVASRRADGCAQRGKTRGKMV